MALMKGAEKPSLASSDHYEKPAVDSFKIATTNSSLPEKSLEEPEISRKPDVVDSSKTVEVEGTAGVWFALCIYVCIIGLP